MQSIYRSNRALKSQQSANKSRQRRDNYQTISRLPLEGQAVTSIIPIKDHTCRLPFQRLGATASTLRALTWPVRPNNKKQSSDHHRPWQRKRAHKRYRLRAHMFSITSSRAQSSQASPPNLSAHRTSKPWQHHHNRLVSSNLRKSRYHLYPPRDAKNELPPTAREVCAHNLHTTPGIKNRTMLECSGDLVCCPTTNRSWECDNVRPRLED